MINSMNIEKEIAAKHLLNMKNKSKKHEYILLELRRRREMNARYCDLNSCLPSSYMEGSNKIIDDMIEYIENLLK